MKKIAVIIPNYNMPESADALAEHLYGRHSQFDLYLVDNGSDLKAPAKHTNVFIPKNCQTTCAILHGMAAANKSGEDYLAYNIIITSTEFADDMDGCAEAIKLFASYSNMVGYHPSLTKDSTTAWKHLIIDYKFAERDLLQPVWMIDNICSFWRKDWLDSIGQFDSRLLYAWGIDLETSYLARKQGRTLYRDELWKVKKTTDIAYTMDRMNMTAHERTLKARANMALILERRYGKTWERKMREEFVTEEMR